MLRHVLITEEEMTALDSIVLWLTEELHARWETEESGEVVSNKSDLHAVEIHMVGCILKRLEKQTPQITDEQKQSLQHVVAHMWNDEQRDFECNPDDGHIFTRLVQLREFLEHEGVEVFPEPDWHKSFEGQPLKM